MAKEIGMTISPCLKIKLFVVVVLFCFFKTKDKLRELGFKISKKIGFLKNILICGKNL